MRNCLTIQFTELPLRFGLFSKKFTAEKRGRNMYALAKKDEAREKLLSIVLKRRSL
jgi:hypothetical protein